MPSWRAWWKTAGSDRREPTCHGRALQWRVLHFNAGSCERVEAGRRQTLHRGMPRGMQISKSMSGPDRYRNECPRPWVSSALRAPLLF